ncbi:MAG: glycosyltransferase family 2 protein [Paludibacteraceae bacterium]
MKITVASIVLNASDNIERTIQSVLNQTYNQIEYIFVDGESTDGTLDVLKKYEKKITKLVIEKDNGLYDAMNKALQLATGDFLIFMNSGDTFINQFVIEGIVNLIKEKNVVYYGDVIFLNTKRKTSSFYGGRFGKHRFCMKNISHQSVFYPQIVYKSHSYDLKYKMAADYVYNFKLKGEKIQFIHIPTFISFFELGGISSSKDNLFEKNKCKIIKKNLGLYYSLYFILKKNIRLRKLFNVN